MPKRQRRIKQRSEKTIAMQPVRDEVIATTVMRAGSRCEAEGLVPDVPCAGRLDTDEIDPRGRRPGGQYDASNTMLLCRCCHEFKTSVGGRYANILGFYGIPYQDRDADGPTHALVLEALWELREYKLRWARPNLNKGRVQERALEAVCDFRAMIAERTGVDAHPWDLHEGAVAVGP